MSIIITGGAGFIGSCIVRRLNDAGYDDIIIVDHIGSTGKWMNMRNKRYRTYVSKEKLWDMLSQMRGGVQAVIHMGACSSTTEKDFDYLWNNNFEYTKRLWEYCAKEQIPFIYASSAATYGDGKEGFDDKTDIDRLTPLNGYGYSKQLFDLWVKHQAKIFPPQYVGLKFFNVYGPNEYEKGNMASMVFHGYRQMRQNGEIRLFKSEHLDYADGEQMRDFIYVKDVCDVIIWLLEHSEVSGLFNVGTGKARSFRQLAEAVFYAAGLRPNIVYIDMPDYLKEKYQYYTQAEMSALREIGYNKPFFDLESGVRDYVQNFLEMNYKNY